MGSGRLRRHTRGRHDHQLVVVAVRGDHDEVLRALEPACERFKALGARHYVERCDMELHGSGLTPAKRNRPDPSRLTPQELAVANRVAAGMISRDIASDMGISIKTVQFHIGNVYSKMGVRTRVQLANRLRSEPPT